MPQSALLLLALFCALPGFGWDRTKAFAYLEQGQRDWANWKHAQRDGGPCISCHTGISYSFARIAAGEKTPRALEKDILDGVTKRLASAKPLSAMTDTGAEAVLNLVMLSFARTSPADPLSDADRTALRLLWEQQGKNGAWSWFRFDLEPWDSETSNFFGATLAARALRVYPEQPGKAASTLQAYLRHEGPKQPLHNQMGWIAFAGDPSTAPKVLSKLWSLQSPDGGWTTAALGPWTTPKSPEAPADHGSNAYATAWAAYTAHESGVPCTDKRLQRALRWLAGQQDPKSGAWISVSMNKAYPANSIQSRFMSHAATGYATAALAACESSSLP